MNPLNRWSQAAWATLAAMLWSLVAFAQTQQTQTGGGSVTTTTTTTEVWYGQWWIWRSASRCS